MCFGRKVLALLCFLVFLSTGGECFLKKPTKPDTQNKGKVQVQVNVRGREKRSITGNTLPESYYLDFILDKSYMHVHLQQNPNINTNVEVFAINSGSIIRKYVTDEEESVFYQDAENGAVFVIQRNKTGGCNTMGFLQHGIFDYVLQSDDDISVGGAYAEFDMFKEPIKKTDFGDVDGPVTPEESIGLKKRRKRATGDYEIELLMVVDYSIYSFWYGQSTAQTPEEKEKEAVDTIKQFYAFVINGMDAMYKNIQTSSYTISILFAGIIIAQTPNDSNWTESIKDTSFDPPQVDASQALDSFENWINSQENLPGHDHAMLFTRYDLSYGGSNGNAGLAYLGAMCSPNSQSIAEDFFNFIVLTVASHELGHSLSAAHDGTGNSCSAAGAYIMAPSAGPKQDSSIATNLWKFSACSTNYFTNYLDDLDSAQSPNCMKVLDAAYNASALAQYEGQLPGQVYDADAQCKLIQGPGSYFCKDFYDGNFSTICTLLWCAKPNDLPRCSGAIAGDGTICGDRKWCISGVCTYDSQAPSGDESCLYGEKEGPVYPNYDFTCADIAADYPWNCPQIQDTCCKSCAPPTTTTTVTTPTSTASTTTQSTSTTQTTSTTASTTTLMTSTTASTTSQSTTTTSVNAQPITVQNVDSQCASLRGVNSRLCRSVYQEDYSTICDLGGFACSSPTNIYDCQFGNAADGTLCGSQSWCISGVCTYDTNAPIIPDEKCLYGDWDPVQCAVVVAFYPTYCKTDETVKKTCCKSCAPLLTTSTTSTSTTTTPTPSTTTTTTTTTTPSPSTTTTTTPSPSTTTTTTTTPPPSTTTTTTTTTTPPPSTTTTTTPPPSTTTTTTPPPSTTTTTTTRKCNYRYNKKRTGRFYRRKNKYRTERFYRKNNNYRSGRFNLRNNKHPKGKYF